MVVLRPRIDFLGLDKGRVGRAGSRSSLLRSHRGPAAVDGASGGGYYHPPDRVQASVDRHDIQGRG